MNVLKKILIVEDDQLLNRTLAYNLTSDGYEVISVFNFDSAVRKLRENEFDVALLDINLPDGSGLDLCEEIRNRGQHTYIWNFFLSSSDSIGKSRGSQNYGCFTCKSSARYLVADDPVWKRISGNSSGEIYKTGSFRSD